MTPGRWISQRTAVIDTYEAARTSAKPWMPSISV
jgi:hypothetical protein